MLRRKEEEGVGAPPDTHGGRFLSQSTVPARV